MTVVQSVLTATCTYHFISLDIPAWVFHELDKLRRGFLWAGKKTASGGHCPVTWPIACRPKSVGGLGIQDLRLASLALRLRWLWFKRTDGRRPWKHLANTLDSNPILHKIFQTSTRVLLGNGNNALFWEDYWLGDRSPCILAPDLCLMVKPHIRKARSVADGLLEKRWIRDIAGRLTVTAISQYVHLWHAVSDVQLQQDAMDIVMWRWEGSGTYSARSAYKFFFMGSVKSPVFGCIWRAWAPLRVKLFMWLATRQRIWTSARRKKHGLQNWDECCLCCQEPETADRLLGTCSYTQQVWHSVDQRIGRASLSPTAGSSFLDWWLLRRRSFLGASKKGFDTTFILVSWHIWKERNHRVFTGDTQRTPQQLAEAITQEAAIWCSAGAHCLHTSGWHFQS